MKEHFGYDTKINGHLKDYLRRSKGESTLYISHYFFALNDQQNLIFFYNPAHYWDELPVEKVDDYVWRNLEKECAVFTNFDPDLDSKNGPLDNKTSYEPFSPETPKIGNHYVFATSNIISHHRHFYFLADTFGAITCVKCNTKDLTDYDVLSFLSWYVSTKTPNILKSIFELSCFEPEEID